jgi:small ligand-binding sensory domain FIST
MRSFAVKAGRWWATRTPRIAILTIAAANYPILEPYLITMKNGEIPDELGGRPPLSGFHIVL